ncbi:hypothetical protein K435DRAFT_774716 [Dendrothele bispora CBS 962.96]|uniref:Uncharacterized protein n=1 Tax=Dendrothele bispora (strain CBS 962.96) TaxID=1314807 RepID=A0A4S8MLV8_DENBC|nr:hypothetical protein K435DRAFT_774716 [Dendrothele bispora CBS 962.96]
MSDERKPTIAEELQKLKELLQNRERGCREFAERKARREEESEQRRAEKDMDRREMRERLEAIKETIDVSRELCASEAERKVQDWNEVLEAVQQSGDARLADLKSLFEEQEEIKRQHRAELLAVLNASRKIRP